MNQTYEACEISGTLHVNLSKTFHSIYNLDLLSDFKTALNFDSTCKGDLKLTVIDYSSWEKLADDHSV